MRARTVAAALGLVVGLATYAALPPAPHPAGRAMPMTAIGVQVHAHAPHIVDSTPMRLVITSIGVDARVESRGLDSSRNLATPNDFHDVAWYNLGPKPGEPGNALINGHVDWWTGDAVFTRLHDIHVGDGIQVIRADGLTVTFKVTGTRTVDAHARVASLFAPSTTATLTLITCTGVWNPLTQSDTQRLLVSASLG